MDNLGNVIIIVAKVGSILDHVLVIILDIRFLDADVDLSKRIRVLATILIFRFLLIIRGHDRGNGRQIDTPPPVRSAPPPCAYSASSRWRTRKSATSDQART